MIKTWKETSSTISLTERKRVVFVGITLLQCQILTEHRGIIFVAVVLMFLKKFQEISFPMFTHKLYVSKRSASPMKWFSFNLAFRGTKDARTKALVQRTFPEQTIWRTRSRGSKGIYKWLPRTNHWKLTIKKTSSLRPIRHNQNIINVAMNASCSLNESFTRRSCIHMTDESWTFH